MPSSGKSPLSARCRQLYLRLRSRIAFRVDCFTLAMEIARLECPRTNFGAQSMGLRAEREPRVEHLGMRFGAGDFATVGAGAFCRRRRRARRLDASVRYYTGNFRFWCARPLIADSSLCPAITRTPSSIRAITLCAVQDWRKAMPFLRQAARTRSRAICISNG